MSAPLCTVTPLEALRRLYDVARKVDAKESGDLEHQLQEAIHVAYWTLAAPVVPVAAQPVVPEGWKLVPIRPTPKMVDSTWGDDMAGMSHNKMNKHIYAAMLAAAPSLEAQPAGEVEKNAARWHQVLRYVGADRSTAMGCQYFVFRGIHAEPGVDLMRGSVAGHFTDVIDAAIAAQQGEKTK